MKKFISTVVLMLLLSCSICASAAMERDLDVSVYVDGKYMSETADSTPFIKDDRTFVPVRAVAEKMGAVVSWDPTTQTVGLKKVNDKITYEGKDFKNCTTSAEFVLGQKTIKISLSDSSGEIFSVTRMMDVAAHTIDGRTYIPARFLGYALGYDIDSKQLFNRFDVYYTYKGRQNLAFGEISDNIKRIDYSYNKQKFPDTTVINNVEYPCSYGYEDTVVVDTTNGRVENGKMINLVPYTFTLRNTIISADGEEYKISNENTPEKNLENFTRFYNDKSTEKMHTKTVSDGRIIYYPEYLTNTPVVISYVPSNEVIDSSITGIEDILPANEHFYCVSNTAPILDWTKPYFINEDGLRTYSISTWDDGFLRRGGNKNTLLFLNEFLGETGQRISKMMEDYYTMEGHSYVAPDTEIKDVVVSTQYFHPVYKYLLETVDIPTIAPVDKKMLINDENSRTTIGADIRPPLTEEIVRKYGLDFVDQRVAASSQITLKTDKQYIYIEYHRNRFTFESAMSYSVYFTEIEN